MEVVNVKVKSIRPKYDNLEKWMKDENNVYIGRRGIVFIKNENGQKERFPKVDSIWHNPFKIKGDMTREDVILKYKEYIEDKLKNDESLRESLVKLKGKKLGCWCKPEKCHGDVLIELIERLV